MASTIPDLNIELIYAEGKPKRAIIDMEALEALLEAAEDLEDAQDLEQLRKESLEFVTLEEHLQARREDESSQSDTHAEVSSHDVRDYHRQAG